MADELRQAISKTLDVSDNDDSELLRAMANLLIILLSQMGNGEMSGLSEELKARLLNKYPKPSSLANQLIPSPS
jgi:hypothetical protein